MLDASLKTPGLYFQAVRAPEEIETLRTDIAGFLGSTQRGPLGRLVRVAGWRDFVNRFGGETRTHATPFCLRGYFENGGQVAYVERLLGPVFAAARATWQVGELDPATCQWRPSAPAAAGFGSARYEIRASSPGAWANDLQVYIDYLLRGRGGEPQLTIKVVTASGETELLTGICPATLEEQVEAQSGLIRIAAVAGHGPAPTLHVGPQQARWGPLSLTDASEQPPGLDQYRTAIARLLAEPEVALMALPDMYALTDPYELLARLAAGADVALDRQVIAALPLSEADPQAAGNWVRQRRRQLAGRSARSVAAYQPWLDVADPLGGAVQPLRRVPSVGHVAGLISRLDRERGAHHTPANAFLYDAVDTSRAYDAVEQGYLVESGLNPLRCRHGRGLEVWGGRTLADRESDPEGLYLAHRRLIHRLVRAIRRVAQPLVFSSNGPALRLVLVRAITTLLLQAFRAGALKGARPEEAFRVVCDESNNPPAAVDLGQVHCEIQLAPAVPMEFITLRIAISAEGRLEVISP